MTHLLLLFAFFFGEAHAADALPYRGVVVETDDMGGTQILDSQMRPVTPGEFAHRIGDWHTAERYKKSYRLHKTASIMMWVYGGVGLVGGFYLAYGGGLIGMTTGSAQFLALSAAGLGFMASAVISLPMGFVWFFQGKKRLNDPLAWWRITELHELADSYNAGLEQRGRRIEIRPILTPGSLALSVRF